MRQNPLRRCLRGSVGMELQRKLEILAEAAKDDVSCASSGAARKDSRGSKGVGSTGGAGFAIRMRRMGGAFHC